MIIYIKNKLIKCVYQLNYLLLHTIKIDLNLNK